MSDTVLDPTTGAVGDPTGPGASATLGVVEAIHITDRRGGELRPVDTVRGRPGRGLEGDRYGSLDPLPADARRSGRDLTLVEAESLDVLARDHGIELATGETRRNVTTRGIALNALVDRRFRVGSVVARGIRLCEPCADLQAAVGKPIMRPLVHRAGLRADILEEGTISVGDEVVPLD